MERLHDFLDWFLDLLFRPWVIALLFTLAVVTGFFLEPSVLKVISIALGGVVLLSWMWPNRYPGTSAGIGIFFVVVLPSIAITVALWIGHWLSRLLG